MIDFAPAVRFALLLIRPGMLVASAPVFGAAFAPVRVRIGLSILLAVALLPSVEVPAMLPPVALALAVARELAIGLALGMAVRALIAGAEFAGHLTGTQIGLSYGSIVDPINGVRNNVIAGLYGNLALLVVFAIDGHHALVRTMSASYASMPIGEGHIDPSLARSVVAMLGLVFVLGVRLALPVMAALLIVELALGLVSRAAPAINLFVVATPVRLVVGLLVLASVLALAPGLVARFSGTALTMGARTAAAFR
ncbi:MAG: flagellar biosynthetic protein FliR [Acidobacteria bacterium]|nr:flagellar biosynthetic protein FliR [Acidobacteriota bacterium]